MCNPALRQLQPNVEADLERLRQVIRPNVAVVALERRRRVDLHVEGRTDAAAAVDLERRQDVAAVDLECRPKE